MLRHTHGMHPVAFQAQAQAQGPWLSRPYALPRPSPLTLTLAQAKAQGLWNLFLPVDSAAV